MKLKLVAITYCLFILQTNHAHKDIITFSMPAVALLDMFRYGETSDLKCVKIADYLNQ